MSLVGYNSNIIITIALISLLSACTRENSLKENQNNREFAQVTTVPAYKEMSMYQLLIISQDRLTH